VTAWSPGSEPLPTQLTSSAGAGPLVADGGRALFVPAHGTSLTLESVDGGPRRPVGATGAGAPRAPLALAGGQAAFTSVSCAGAPQVTVVDVAAAPGVNGCPVILPRSVRVPGKLRVTCPNGCVAKLELVRRELCADPDSSGPLPTSCRPKLATADLRLGPSPNPQPVPLRITRRDHRRHENAVAVLDSPGPELVRSLTRLTYR
jgi:hypothetical protein